MNGRTRFFLSIGIPLLLLIVVGALYVRQQMSPNSQTSGNTPAAGCNGKLTPMKFALDWTPNTNHTGVYVAREKGWYAAQCIDLTILPYSNVSADTLVSSGQADVGISSTESIVADTAVGQPVISIAAIVQHNTSALISLAGSNLKSPRDFDGKTYGGFGAPYESAVVKAIIRQAGGQGNFKNVTLDIDTMQALETRRIDFAWVYEGWEVIQAQLAGFQVNVFPITSYGIPDYYTPNIITSPQKIKQSPDLLRRFMTATSQGYEFARSHAQEAGAVLIKQAGADNFPDQNLVYKSQQFLSTHYVDSGRKWGWQDAAAWQGYPGFMLKNSAILDANNKPVTSMDFNTLYTNQFIG
ncbi:MAG TPA: ABC transporter substrate-binding protein [Ktedonobacteraceae bacterium]|nr:ABC transporter substrate-binding protein [Ktedonobacteraceae bacterium]